MTPAELAASELHDGAMQEITLARLQLDLLSTGVHDADVLRQIAELSEVLGEASHRLQEIMRALIVQTSS